jgi:acyl carrier protein
MPVPPTVEDTLRAFLARIEKVTDFDATTPLYAEGIGLDSLETAELSAVLEDTYLRDPFTSDDMPQTVGDLLRFYASEVA